MLPHLRMTVTGFSQSELHHPVRFLTAALHDLRRSPPLAWRLFRTTLRARYRRAWLRYLWLLLPTVGMTGAWVYVESHHIIAVPSPGMPYPVFVLTGTILWQLFVDAMNSPLQQLSAARQMITRTLVPHEALILAGVLEILLNCAARLAVLVVLLVALHVPTDLHVLLVPFGIAAVTLLGITIGLFLAPVGMLYDDVGRAIALVTGLWLFVTPVFYRLPRRGLLRLNPVTPLIDSTRAWLTSAIAPPGMAAVTAMTMSVLVVAWLFQRIARPHVIARLG